MLSVPGIGTRARPGPAEVRCRCGRKLTSLAVGQRVVRSDAADRFIDLTCLGCGVATRLPVAEEAG